MLEQQNHQANAEAGYIPIMRIRTVAKEGALQALASSRTGTRTRQRDYELDAAKAENARLSVALKEMAVRLTLVEVLDAGASSSAQ
jgi:transposase